MLYPNTIYVFSYVVSETDINDLMNHIDKKKLNILHCKQIRCVEKLEVAFK